MIDPVRLGAVKGPAETPRSVQPQMRDAALARPAGQGARASLPKLVSLAADLARHGPPIDHARIAQVRAAIAQGSYTIDVDAIATALLTTGAPEVE